METILKDLFGGAGDPLDIGSGGPASTVGVGAEAPVESGVDENIGRDLGRIRGREEVVAVASVELSLGEDLAQVVRDMDPGGEVASGEKTEASTRNARRLDGEAGWRRARIQRRGGEVVRWLAGRLTPRVDRLWGLLE